MQYYKYIAQQTAIAERAQQKKRRTNYQNTFKTQPEKSAHVVFWVVLVGAGVFVWWMVF